MCHLQPGESGFVLLGDLTVETSTDPDPEPEDSWTLGDPPSPCDVRFQNDNVIINGKSNMRNKSRDQKVCISFESIPFNIMCHCVPQQQQNISNYFFIIISKVSKS